MATKKSPAVKNAKKAKAASTVAKSARVAAKKPVAKKQAAKSVQKKAVAAPKKSTPAKAKATKTSTKTVKKAPVKKAAVKVSVKKAAPKKAAPATKKKAVVTVKKVAGKKTSMTKKTATTVNKKAAPTKKAAVQKKATPQKAAVAKKEVTKKAAPAAKVAVKKKEAPVAVKKVATKEVVTKQTKPATKPTAKAPVKTKNATASKTTSAAKAGLPVMPKAQPPVAKPAPVVERAEKKPAVVVAHRKLEKKSKQAEEAGKTMINYQPEFTRSILDEPTHSGPVYRYSDEELQEFKELILSRLESARKELTYLQGLITRKDEAGTEDTENRYMNMEDGSGAMEREQLAQLASRQIQFINHLEKALIRIENKTYGICRVTGKLIDKARLRAVPHATLSIEAKKTMNK